MEIETKVQRAKKFTYVPVLEAYLNIDQAGTCHDSHPQLISCEHISVSNHSLFPQKIDILTYVCSHCQLPDLSELYTVYVTDGNLETTHL